MRNPPGYNLKEKLVDRAHVLVYRAFSEKLGCSVILKILRSEFPTTEQLAAYENEFAILKEALGEGIPRAFELLVDDKRRILVLEDVEGVSLAQFVKKTPLSLPEKLQIAMKITHALAALHAKGIIHRDMKPDNIVVNARTGRLQISDFGLARRAEKIEVAQALAGTLQYISPEQTGRTQNSIDYRSDVYSLGVLFYELFSGVLPFQARDEMEWVHSHIALTETPLHEVDSRIPRPIAMIVQKLMKKSPEERYQSCLGIIRDLEACADMRDHATFHAGAHDVSAELRLSGKLYGREEEIKLVNRILAKVVLGAKRLVLIDGDPGVGKSSLVNVVKDSAKESAGYFIFGKFDQFRKDIPFSALIQAFNQLVAQILTEDEKSIRDWKERILSAVGENAAVVTAILPQIELITGKVPPVSQLESQEQRLRFLHSFHAFIRACCKHGRPLVIFLDDLQWADSASRALIQSFLVEKEAESLLFIGAYRHAEVTVSHPLRQMLADVEAKNLEVDRVHLSSLSPRDVLELIADAFPVTTSNREALAELVFAKTNGNPFFVSQFLKSLHDKKLLRFDPYSGWTWDLGRIETQGVTDNVLTLLGDKISLLNNDTQEALQLAACFGNYFKVEDLKSYNAKSDVENSILLQPAVDGGLIAPGARGDYRFIHDRVQEAAYKSMSADKRVLVHWRIANRLLRQWPEQKLREGIFYLVNHWNAGAGQIASREERAKSAELNLMAASRAKDSSVHDLALHYAVTGLELLKSDDWEADEPYLKPLVLLRASAEAALGRYVDAERNFHLALSKMKDDVEKARVYRTMADVAHLMGRNRDSMRWAVMGLRLVGIRVPRNPGKLRLLRMLLRNRRLSRARLNSGVTESIRPSSESKREIILLLASVAAPAYSLNKKMLAYIGLASVELSLREGFLDLGGRSLFCAYLWSQLGDFAMAKESADYLLKYFESPEIVPGDYRGFFGLTAFTSHLVHSYEEAIRHLLRGHHMLSLNGDVLYASNSLIHSGVMSVFIDRKLEQAADRLTRYQEMVAKLNYEIVAITGRTVELWVEGLRGARSKDYEARLKLQYQICVQAPSPLPLGWFYITRAFNDILHGDYKKAMSEIAEYELADSNAPFTSMAIQMRLLTSIARMKCVDDYAGVAKLKQLFKIRTQLRFFRKLADCNPKNFRAAYLMLEGEWLAMRGKGTRAIAAFQAAIQAAKNSEIVFYEPLANELLAHVCFKQGVHRAGMLSIREAAFLYENWGAKSKVSQLEKQYPDLALRSAAAPALGDSTGTISHASSQKMDLDTVLKATNTLIAEMDMSRLVKKLLNILIENAGAERGVLFLMENGGLAAKGELSVKTSGEFKLEHIPLENFDRVPHAMITYVARTLETMVIENSLADGRLSRDAFVRENQVLSSVCLPILKQGELRGLVYMENNAAKGVFSPQRVELMTVLSGQIAISLENAQLYQQQAEAIRMQQELVTAHAVQGMLFPPPQYEADGVQISGYYQPATECGGDWWSYSRIGDWVYTYIGDATGHGAPAALVTSAACSAVSVIEAQKDITPEKAMEYLNKAVCRTTKGQINMTFFVGALNVRTGEFRFVRASHEPPMLMRKSKMHGKAGLRAMFEPLMGVNGLSLGESSEEKYESASLFLEPGDSIILYTDGLPELVNGEEKVLGERGFFEAVHKSFLESSGAEEANVKIVERVQRFRGAKDLQDDITFCLLRYTGRSSAGKKSAA